MFIRKKRSSLVCTYCYQISQLDDDATASKNAFEAERERCHAASRDLDNFRKAHRKLESDMAMLEMQAAEQRLVAESKDERLRKCEEEICHLVRTLAFFRYGYDAYVGMIDCVSA